MPRRVQYAKIHDDFINELVRADDTTGPFETRAKCLTFAASFGASYGAETGRKKLPTRSSDICEPIRYDVFQSQEFEDLICGLSVFATKNIKILKSDEETANHRITIFEEFAHLGLDKLKAELKGEIDLTDGIALLLKKKYSDRVAEGGTIDWSKVVSI